MKGSAWSPSKRLARCDEDQEVNYLEVERRRVVGGRFGRVM